MANAPRQGAAQTTARQPADHRGTGSGTGQERKEKTPAFLVTIDSNRIDYLENSNMARNPKRSIAALATVALAIALLALVRADAGGDAKKTPKEKDKTDWKPLLDGKSLTGWKATNFGGEGDVSVKNGIVLLERG